MSLTIGGITFDDHEYDSRGDVLYLSVGNPRPATRTIETPEGHAVHYDEAGAVIGMTLLNVRATVARHGQLTVTWPQASLSSEQLESLVPAA